MSTCSYHFFQQNKKKIFVVHPPTISAIGITESFFPFLLTPFHYYMLRSLKSRLLNTQMVKNNNKKKFYIFFFCFCLRINTSTSNKNKKIFANITIIIRRRRIIRHWGEEAKNVCNVSCALVKDKNKVKAEEEEEADYLPRNLLSFR